MRASVLFSGVFIALALSGSQAGGSGDDSPSDEGGGGGQRESHGSAGHTAGTSGMQMRSPLERKLRDAHGCATHRWVAHPLFTDLGKILGKLRADRR